MGCRGSPVQIWPPRPFPNPKISSRRGVPCGRLFHVHIAVRPPSTTTSLPVTNDASSTPGKPRRRLCPQAGRCVPMAPAALLIIAQAAAPAGSRFLKHRRVDRAGMHRVAADSLAGVLDGGGLGEQPHRTLGAAIAGQIVVVAHQPGGGRYVDDAAAAGFPQCRQGSLVPRNTPFAFTSKSRSHSSTVISSMLRPRTIPALFTSTLSLPYSETAAVTASAQSFSLVTSRCT